MFAIIVPPGVDIQANIAEARQVARECEEKALKIAYAYRDMPGMVSEQGLAQGFKCSWIYDNFKAGARYDFKRDGHPEYEDFGNYHYGLYTHAMGINATFAQIAAGAAQVKAGTYRLRDLPTFLDDRRDNEKIREGQRFPLDW
ncbi:MAG: polymorphic toxin type 44 domain-containing protein [Desulfovibrionaceae bacterium]